jgi:uncharacterized delta-60 repeat protein
MILLGGTFTNIQGWPSKFLARLEREGGVDYSFEPNVDGPTGVTAILLQSDGRIVIGGGFSSAGGAARSYLTRLLPGSISTTGGGVDGSFFHGSGPNGQILALAGSRSAIYVAGLFSSFDGAPRPTIVRLSADGFLDTTFTTSGPALQDAMPDVCPSGLATNVPLSLALALQPDGKLIVGGRFTSFGGAGHTNLVRLYPNGTVDPTFNLGSGPNNQVDHVAVQRDGKVLIAGCFNLVNGLPRSGLARLLPDGSLDPDFNPLIVSREPPAVRTLLLQDDGRVLFGGNFVQVNGRPAYNLARLDGGILLFRETLSGQHFSASIATLEGRAYFLEFTRSIDPPAWTQIDTFTGDGGVHLFTDPNPSTTYGFYRLRVE